MGTTTLRHWDAREYASRPALAGDPPSGVFEAYVPHPISGWTPALNARTWQLVATATQRCRGLSPAGAKLPAERLLNWAESIASSSIEGIRPSAREVARAEARLSLFDERPPPKTKCRRCATSKSPHMHASSPRWGKPCLSTVCGGCTRR